MFPRTPRNSEHIFMNCFMLVRPDKRNKLLNFEKDEKSCTFKGPIFNGSSMALSFRFTVITVVIVSAYHLYTYTLML